MVYPLEPFNQIAHLFPYISLYPFKTQLGGAKISSIRIDNPQKNIETLLNLLGLNGLRVDRLGLIDMLAVKMSQNAVTLQFEIID